MTATVTDLAVRTLAGVLDLDVERTQYRDHARELAGATTADLVIVHGGDGSINEVVNGVMGLTEGRPLIAVIPGGVATERRLQMIDLYRPTILVATPSYSLHLANSMRNAGARRNPGELAGDRPDAAERAARGAAVGAGTADRQLQ